MYPITQIGFAALTLGFYGLVLKYLRDALTRSCFEAQRQRRIMKRVVIALAAWMAAVSALSINEFFSNFDTFPPRLMIVLVVPLVTFIAALLFSKTTKELLPYIPPNALVTGQVFRLFVEVLLWMLFVDHLLPEQMTFEGRNFDILVGITGPIVGYLAFNKHIFSRRIVLVWNFIGLGLLINIVSIAILSMPTPFRYFMQEPSNTIVTKFPIIWLPAFLVPLAYGLHFLSIRQLINKTD